MFLNYQAQQNCHKMQYVFSFNIVYGFSSSKEFSVFFSWQV